jgi:hypothetical protein
MSANEDLSIGLAEQAQLIQWHVGVWHDLGYPEPLPSPDCKPIPPLGERSADAIKGGHEAIKDIDELTRQLYALRSQLVGELRQDEDVRAARVDAMLAERRRQRSADPDAPSCGCPVDNGLVRHARAMCTDPVVARLGWYFDGQERQS